MGSQKTSHQAQKQESAPTSLSKQTHTKQLLVIYLPCQAILLAHVDADQRPRRKDTQEITQGVNQNKGNPIKNWLSTIPLSLENFVDPFLQKTSANMPPNTTHSSTNDQTSTGHTQTPGTEMTKSANGFRVPKFSYFLSRRNIFINDTEASPRLLERAMNIITNEKSSRRMADACAEKLAVEAWDLETGVESSLVRKLVIPLILRVLHKNLEMSQNIMRSFAVKVPTKQPRLTRLPRLPRPQSDLVFGYSRSAFNKTQFQVSQLLVTKMGKHYALDKHYAMSDWNILFPFWF